MFQIKNPRWANYWQQQAYAVMLVIRTSNGQIRWMDVSACLKRESAGGKTVRQIVFAGGGQRGEGESAVGCCSSRSASTLTPRL